MLILAIDTTGFSSSLALVKNGKEVIFNIVSPGFAEEAKWRDFPYRLPKIHRNYILNNIDKVFNKHNINWSDIDAIAVSAGSGIFSCIIEGVSIANTLASVYKKPVIEIDHILAHVYSTWLERDPESFKFPIVSFSASGSHSDFSLLPNIDTYQTVYNEVPTESDGDTNYYIGVGKYFYRLRIMLNKEFNSKLKKITYGNMEKGNSKKFDFKKYYYQSNLLYKAKIDNLFSEKNMLIAGEEKKFVEIINNIEHVVYKIDERKKKEILLNLEGEIKELVGDLIPPLKENLFKIDERKKKEILLSLEGEIKELVGDLIPPLKENLFKIDERKKKEILLSLEGEIKELVGDLIPPLKENLFKIDERKKKEILLSLEGEIKELIGDLIGSFKEEQVTSENKVLTDIIETQITLKDLISRAKIYLNHGVLITNGNLKKSTIENFQNRLKEIIIKAKIKMKNRIVLIDKKREQELFNNLKSTFKVLIKNTDIEIENDNIHITNKQKSEFFTEISKEIEKLLLKSRIQMENKIININEKRKLRYLNEIKNKINDSIINAKIQIKRDLIYIDEKTKGAKIYKIKENLKELYDKIIDIDNQIKLIAKDVDNIKYNQSSNKKINDGDLYNFDFSSISAGVEIILKEQKKKNKQLNNQFLKDVAASFQNSIIEILICKILRIAKLHNAKEIHIVGGISANAYLEKKLKKTVAKEMPKVNMIYPTKTKYKFDNAAMIGALAFYQKKYKIKFNGFKPSITK